ATSSTLVLDAAGYYTVAAGGTGLTGANSASFIFPARRSYDLAFSVQPGSSTAGAAISPAVKVQVLDQFGNLLTSDSIDQVTLTVASGPSGFAPGSTKTATVTGGITTFSNLVLNTAGAYTLAES